MNIIFNIIIWPYIICAYVYSFIKEIFVDSIIEHFQKRHRPQQIIEKFRNYDNLTAEERTIDSTEGLEEEHYEVLNEIVKSWFDNKKLDEERCNFISDVSDSLIWNLFDDIKFEKIPFTEKDYIQLIRIYEHINRDNSMGDYDFTLECAEYIRRYWLESGEKPIPITNKANLDYSKMGKFSLKDLEKLEKIKMENDQKELCYYITNLEMIRKKADTSIYVQLSLFADRIEIYEPGENDIYGENHNIVIKKGKYETILLGDIEDLKFNNWEEVKAYYNLRSEKRHYEDILKFNKEYSEDIAYKNTARKHENVTKRLEEYDDCIKKYLLEICCVDGKVYSFSDAREPEALILRALILYFIQKQVELVTNDNIQ